MKVILVPVILALSGCIVFQSQFDDLVGQVKDQREAVNTGLRNNQSNQAQLANEHVAMVKAIQSYSKRIKDEQLSDSLVDRRINGEVIANRAEELANVNLPDIRDIPNPLSGIIDMILAALMANPTTAGIATVLTGLIGQQAWKNNKIKKERTQLYAEKDKLIKKVARVAMLNPADDKEKIIEELDA